jgi:hypothetical protein
MHVNPKSKSKKLVLIIVIASVISLSLIISLPLFFSRYIPPEDQITPEYHYLSGNLYDTVNENDFSFQNKTIINLNSTLSHDNRTESIETGYDLLEASWNGTYYVLNNTCVFDYAYNDSFINSVKFYTDYFARSSSNMPPVDWYFWNFSSSEFQYNKTTIWGLSKILVPDYFKLGKIMVRIFSYSNDTFSLIRKFRCEFKYDFFYSPEVVKYVDLGNTFQIRYNNITWDSNDTYLKVKFYWSESIDNFTWSQYEPLTTFSGFGMRYIRLNVSVELCKESYLFNQISINYENCSYYYYHLDTILYGLVNDTIENMGSKIFNFTFLILSTTEPVLESSIRIYNYELDQWDAFGDFSVQKIQDLNVSHYFKNIMGYKINFKANSSLYFVMQYSIQISIGIV